VEDEIRQSIVDLMPIEHAPAHLRLAFHDAGTWDAQTQTGGAHGTIRLRDELWRGENTGWGQACLELLAEVRTRHPDVSWADLIALGGAAAVQKSGGPIVEVGLGRTDSDEPAPRSRLPGGYEGPGLLKRIFARMGLSPREMVVLSGAHTLGHFQHQPFTSDPWEFSNSYFVRLLAEARRPLLPSDDGLITDPELFEYVKL
jgi:L-ascorbate peroxidase